MPPSVAIQNLFEKYKLPEPIRLHCEGVGRIAFEIAKNIEDKLPESGINPEKVYLAAACHDIGKCRPGIHEINTVEILCCEGLGDIAPLAMHGFVYEIHLLRGEERPEYLPHRLENKIVVLADMYYNQRQERVSLEERFDDIRARYREDKTFLKAVDLAFPRIQKLEQEILGYLE